MKTILCFLSGLSVVGLLACGDDATSGTSNGGEGGSGNGGSASGAQGGMGSAAGGDGGTSVGGNAGGAGGGNGGAGGADCVALQTAVYDALQLAKGCDPSNDGPNVCTSVIEGLCCPEIVNATNTAQIADYNAKLNAVKAAQCMVPCPAVPCNNDPQGACVGQGTMGLCQEAPQ
jgi:hypothetical protein